MRAPKLIASILLWGSFAFAGAGDLTVNEPLLISKSKTCVLTFPAGLVWDFKVFCSGEIAIQAEGAAPGFNQERKFDERQKVLSKLLGIMYASGFEVFQESGSTPDLNALSSIFFVKSKSN